MGKLSQTTLDGYHAEQRFKSKVESLGFKVTRPPGVYDRLEHWDLLLMLKVDCKYMKKINRSDKEVQDEWHWLELSSQYGDNKGWIYGSKADAIAFEKEKSWVIVTIQALKDLIERYVKDEWVKTAEEAKYKRYRRKNTTLEEITLVETKLLKEYGWEMSK